MTAPTFSRPGDLGRNSVPSPFYTMEKENPKQQEKQKKGGETIEVPNNPRNATNTPFMVAVVENRHREVTISIFVVK
jgi:hypothetical protein